MSYALQMWVIYQGPIDLPEVPFLARLWEMMDGKMRPTGSVITASALEPLRAEFDRRGLVMLCRDPGDDPKIVETWL